jgi:hypothetical protein
LFAERTAGAGVATGSSLTGSGTASTTGSGVGSTTGAGVGSGSMYGIYG